MATKEFGKFGMHKYYLYDYKSEPEDTVDRNI
jgi:hypothetical protein